jgi:chemotaxis protein CheX
MNATISLNEALFGGAKEVFETMIFMSLERCTESSAAPQGNCLLGTMTFTGGLQGCLGICCSEECAKNIAMNMLGLGPDAEISTSEINDAMGEVTNMITGSFKTRIIESVGDVQVSIPSVVRGRSIDTVLIGGEERISLPVLLDENVVLLSLLSKRRSCDQ